MTVDEIRERIRTVPFVPFTLNIADGRQIPVVGRDFILVSPTGRSVIVYQKSGKNDYLDARLITGVTVEESTPAASPEANGPNP